jgi:thiol:disulfide interchange protein DsbD
VQTGHVELELVGASTAAVPGSTLQVAVRQKIMPGWHTYWRNSGDAGQPTEISWKLPKGFSAAAPVWPTPQRLPEATLMTFGYKGEVVTPIAVSVGREVRPAPSVRLTAHVDLLVCQNLCIPESADLALDLPVAATSGPSAQAPLLAQALAAAPAPAPFTATASLKDGVLRLAFVGPALDGIDPSGAYFFPDDTKTLTLTAPQAVERGTGGFTLLAKPAPELTAQPTAPITGVLTAGGHAWEVTAKPGTPTAAAVGPSAAGIGGFLLALGAGVIGGLILNLMPCVFPVLAIKAAALAENAHRPGEARLHGLAFLVSTVATFLVLAALLLAARAAGEAAGWGFQLQSPGVTAGLALLVLAVALNLSGVFEAGLSVQRVGGEVSTGKGVAGAFLTGVLAVLVAAPCTAPFMALATGYALTAPLPLALCVFAALGLGLALPFTLLCFSPALLSRLPRPGQWMETLRRLLAFPMYGAAAWLTWVFVQQTGAEALGLFFAAAVCLAFALHLFGGAQHNQALGKGSVVGLLFAGLAVTGAVFLTAVAATLPPETGAASTQVDRALKAEPFTPARLAELRSQGKPVFVNLTAAWCVTCKVNERVALSQPEVAQAFARTGTAYLVGDWTRRDAAIAKTLSDHGRAGVPLYLLYRPGASEPVVLPQLLTAGTVVGALTAK